MVQYIIKRQLPREKIDLAVTTATPSLHPSWFIMCLLPIKVELPLGNATVPCWMKQPIQRHLSTDISQLEQLLPVWYVPVVAAMSYPGYHLPRDGAASGLWHYRKIFFVSHWQSSWIKYDPFPFCFVSIPTGGVYFVLLELQDEWKWVIFLFFGWWQRC